MKNPCFNKEVTICTYPLTSSVYSGLSSGMADRSLSQESGSKQGMFAPTWTRWASSMARVWFREKGFWWRRMTSRPLARLKKESPGRVMTTRMILGARRKIWSDKDKVN